MLVNVLQCCLLSLGVLRPQCGYQGSLLWDGFYVPSGEKLMRKVGPLGHIFAKGCWFFSPRQLAWAERKVITAWGPGQLKGARSFWWLNALSCIQWHYMYLAHKCLFWGRIIFSVICKMTYFHEAKLGEMQTPVLSDWVGRYSATTPPPSFTA